MRKDSLNFDCRSRKESSRQVGDSLKNEACPGKMEIGTLVTITLFRDDSNEQIHFSMTYF